ncbi:MAG: choice-of-anchor D domain-containing protein [Deltaproteobacteria bacterium]|nr:MAG: choice-of-anchor D domain-containing protein [Deltaproteobacteria bacterium]
MRHLALIVLLTGCVDYGVTAREDGGDPQGPEGPHPQILVDPPEIDFGTNPRQQTGYAALSITNIGEAPLRLIELFPPDAEGIHLGQLNDAVLEPDEMTGVGISWSPTTFESLSSSLTIESNDPTQEFVEIPLIGRVPAPQIEVTPHDHDFGTVERGETVDLQVSVSNVGEDTLRIDKVEHFSTSENELFIGDLGGLATLPLELDPGTETELTVRYRPFDDILDEGQLIVHSDDPTNAEATASQIGNGTPGRDYDVEIFITSDDEWEGSLNGVSITGTNAADWRAHDVHTERLPSGTHVLTIRSWDNYRVVAGMIAFVRVDGDVWHASGDGSFKLSRTSPPADWTDPSFDASAWPEADLCNASDASVWSPSRITEFIDAGAQWIWHSTNCRVYGEAWFRVEIELP